MTPDERFVELAAAVNRLLDGDLTPEAFDRLDRIMCNDPAAREFYCNFVELHGQLSWTFAGLNAEVESNAPQSGSEQNAPVNFRPASADKIAATASLPASPAHDSTPVLGFLGTVVNLSVTLLSSSRALTIAVIGGLATYFVGLMISIAITRAMVATRSPRPDGSLDVSARLTADQGCRWQTHAPRVGSSLERQALEIAAGTAEVTFGSGARVVVEGPAAIEVVSAGRMRLNRGRLAASVPEQAVGFTVVTPCAEIVDLGTEFGVEVEPGGKTDVHVLVGKVDVKQAQVVETTPVAAVRVVAGEAVRVTGTGQPVSRIPVDRRSFGNTLRAVPAGATASQTSNKSLTQIWLGNLFDDKPHISLAEAMRTDTFRAAPTFNDTLGVVCLAYGGDPVKDVAPAVRFDLKSVGWGPEGYSPLAVANDARATNGGGLRLNGVPLADGGLRIGEGIGMHANTLITFDLDEIRIAGKLEGRELFFLCDQIGVNDDVNGKGADAKGGSVHLVLVASTADAVRTAVVDGTPARLAEAAGIWSVVSPLGEPLRADGRFVHVRVPMLPEDKYLTLISSEAGDGAGYDHGVWLGARLEVSP